MKKKVLLIASMALIATLSVKSTVAYLQSQTETIVNTMEMGNVSIKQLEYERVVDENGNWVLAGDEEDQYGYYPEKLQEYTQNKALFPAVFTDGDIKWDDRNGSQAPNGETSHQQSWGQIGAPGSNQLFDDSVKNVIDKFVFVENDGKNDAYVRTWIAYEQGDILADDYLKTVQMNVNGNWWKTVLYENDVMIKDEDGNEHKYTVFCYEFKGSDSSHTGILEPNTITRPSLLQVYMKPTATNEDVKAIDANGNGKFDILVLSQAVQTAGFSDAETALNAAFGEPIAENHPFNK